MPEKDLLLRSIRKEPVERFPVWLMRQAGRYMKEYRELRSRVDSFLELCKDVDLATKISLLPLELLGVDGIIIFSDILVPLESLGIRVSFVEGEGPRVVWSGDLSSLNKYDPSYNGFVYEIIKRVKEAQDEVPVIGFSGAPFTLASYILEGGSTRDFRNTKLFMWGRKAEFSELMEVLTDTVYEYLSHQIEAGADVVQVFDSWCGVLSRSDYEELVFPHVEELVKRLKERYDTPIIYFFEGSSAFIDLALELEADVLSTDWSVDLPSLMARHDKVFQGNLEPSVLYADNETIKLKALELLRSIPRKTGYIFNLGHGLAPDMEFDKVKLLVDTVQSFSV